MSITSFSLGLAMTQVLRRSHRMSLCDSVATEV